MSSTVSMNLPGIKFLRLTRTTSLFKLNAGKRISRPITNPECSNQHNARVIEVVPNKWEPYKSNLIHTRALLSVPKINRDPAAMGVMANIIWIIQGAWIILYSIFSQNQPYSRLYQYRLARMEIERDNLTSIHHILYYLDRISSKLYLGIVFKTWIPYFSRPHQNRRFRLNLLHASHTFKMYAHCQRVF